MTAFSPLLGALAAVGFLLASSPAQAAGTPPPPPTAGKPSAAADVAKARALMKTGRDDEALAILRPLAKGRDAPSNALFLLGLAAIGAAHRPDIAEDDRDVLLDEAIAVLRRMLIRRPELVRVRLELARAFFLKGEDTLARRHFEQVLAGKPPAAVALNVNRFLNIMRARKRWSVRVGAALAPDSNISAQTKERTIVLDTPFGRLPFNYRSDDEPETGTGVSVWAGGEYQYPLNERWRLRSGADFSRREYRSSEFDRMNVAAHLGPRWLIGRASEASLLASVRQSWLSDEADWRDLGVRIEGRHRLNRRTTAFLNTARHERRYEERTRLDGPLTDVSGGIDWVATPTLRIDAGIGWGRQRTEQEIQRHSYRSARLGATFLLPWGFTLGGVGTLRWTDYEGSWAPFVIGGGERRDLTRTMRLNVHNRGFTVAGFSPRASLVTEERSSNAQLHGYERIFGELSFVRLF